MDETSLHELFERVIEGEPPIGSVAQQSIRAGIRLRRRRRAQNVVAGVAAMAVVAGGVLAATGSRGSQPATVVSRGTVYVLSFPSATSGFAVADLTPIAVATNTPGPPIALGRGGSGGGLMAATPDEKTIYVGGPGNTVTPVSTVTGRAGNPITVTSPLDQASNIVMSPDGKAAYVIGTGGPLTPISTATNRPGPPLQPWGQAMPMSMAMTPDGQTLYVGVDTSSPTSPNYVIPISTATDEPGRPIWVASSPEAIVITPDGRTAYVIGEARPQGNSSASPSSGEVAVTPIATATNTAAAPVFAAKGTTTGLAVMTPDGQHVYITTTGPSSLIPFSTATGRSGSPISFGSSLITALAAAPDGRTVYVASELQRGDVTQCPAVRGAVTPVDTATGRPGKPVQVACSPEGLAVTPDGKTVYVVSSRGVVTPIAAATDQPEAPVQIPGDLGALLITP